MRRISCLLIAGAVCLPVLQGCDTAPGQVSGVEGPLRITATTGMIADAVRQVAGEHGEVAVLMGPGVDPHLYKPTHGDLSKLGEASIIFYNGLHLEGKMTDVLVKLASRIPTVAVGAGVPEERLREPEEFEGHYDPHIWFDVSLWMHAVETIRDELSALDPANAAAYSENAGRYLESLETLHHWVGEQIASLPEEARLLITAHDAFGYFGRAYGMEVEGIQGISTVSEYGLKDLDRLVEIIVARGLKAVFVESSVSTRSIEALQAGVAARGHTVRIGGTLYSDALGDAGTEAATYEGMVRHNVRTIVESLS